MKLRHLKEASDSAGFFRAMDIVKKECGKYISNVESTQQILLRGTKSPPQQVTKVPIRTDRRPLNSKYSSTAIFNVFFEMKTGVDLIRHKSLFVTNSESDADYYGIPSLVFPTDSSKYAYNPNVNDSLKMMTGPINQILNDYYKTDPKKYTQFEKLAAQLKGAMRVEDADKIMISLIEDEAMYSPLLANYKMYESLDLSKLGKSTEVSIFGAPHYYMVPLTAIGQQIGMNDIRVSDALDFLFDEVF